MRRTGSVEVERVGTRQSDITTKEGPPQISQDTRVVHRMQSEQPTMGSVNNTGIAAEPTAELANSTTETIPRGCGASAIPVQHDYYYTEEKRFWKERNVSPLSDLGMENIEQPRDKEYEVQLGTFERGKAASNKPSIYVATRAPTVSTIPRSDSGMGTPNHSLDPAVGGQARTTLDLEGHRSTVSGYPAAEKSPIEGYDRPRHTFPVSSTKLRQKPGRGSPYVGAGVAGSCATMPGQPHARHREPVSNAEQLGVGGRSRPHERCRRRRRVGALRDAEKLLGGVLETVQGLERLPGETSASPRWTDEVNI